MEDPLATMIWDNVLERPSQPPVAAQPNIYTIHATRDDQTIVTHRIIPDVAVAQARMLATAGWRVPISGAGGRQFAPSEFDQMLHLARV